jgi:hypothetical protein
MYVHDVSLEGLRKITNTFKDSVLLADATQIPPSQALDSPSIAVCRHAADVTAVDVWKYS